jgi:Glycosyl hydrolases family 15
MASFEQAETGYGYGALQVEDFLDRPEALFDVLRARGTLSFTPYRSGLFPASDLAGLTPEEAEVTGMRMAWLRDNAHVANALYKSGREDFVALAVNAGSAMLAVLQNNQDVLDGVVEGRYAPDDPMYRLPVRVRGDTLENDTEHRIQNDSVGYALWFTSRLIQDARLPPTAQNFDTLKQTVRYLEKIRYWEDSDEGAWEEERAIHTSSIGIVMAGLRSVKATIEGRGHMLDLPIDELIEQGAQALRLAWPYETTWSDQATAYDHTKDGPYPDELTRHMLQDFEVDIHEYDAALLFLVEPTELLEGAQAREVVESVTQNLLRPHGMARYHGDTYWGPRFPSILSREERTTSAEGRTENRNSKAAGIAYSGTEAQWTLFDPLLAAYWGKQYMESFAQHDRDMQLFHLNRTLSQLVPTADGRLLPPEASYLEYDEGRNIWRHNEHLPLLWSQANLLLALKIFEDSYRA